MIAAALQQTNARVDLRGSCMQEVAELWLCHTSVHDVLNSALVGTWATERNVDVLETCFVDQAFVRESNRRGSVVVFLWPL